MTPQYILRKSLCRPAHCYSSYVPGKGYVGTAHVADGNQWSVVDPTYHEQRKRSAMSEIENMGYATEYAEPGYKQPDKGILFADWNVFPSKVTDLLERYGYKCEWSDEWSFCDGCGKAFRTSPDSYGWKQSWVEVNNSFLCEECILVNPDDYLESLEGNCHAAITFDIDPVSDFGYVLIGDRYENGMHYGQNDSPEVIAKSLEDLGITRYIFKIDSVGQFDVRFSVYVHTDDMPGVMPEIESALPYDQATELAKALRGEPTPYYTVTTTIVNQKDLLK